MKVELRAHIGVNMATGKPETIRHYRVFADGRAVGFIGWKPGAKLLFATRVGPIEEREISAEVARLMERAVKSTNTPDVPLELLRPNEDEELSADDFDEG